MTALDVLKLKAGTRICFLYQNQLIETTIAQIETLFVSSDMKSFSVEFIDENNQSRVITDQTLHLQMFNGKLSDKAELHSEHLYIVQKSTNRILSVVSFNKSGYLARINLSLEKRYGVDGQCIKPLNIVVPFKDAEIIRGCEKKTMDL